MRAWFLVALFVVGGCHREQTAGRARVSGRVSFSGIAPAPVKLDLSANPTCERQHLRPVYSEDVVVSKSGGLKNILVRVKSGLAGARWTVPVESVKLDQVGCVYQPHVLAVMAGQTLEVSNSDALNHNVHVEATADEAFNVAQPPRAEKLFRKFERPAVMVPVTCGVHGWMRAYLSVIEHPFFAVTDEDGKFELQGLPAGSYVLEAVHEKFGHQERPFTVGAQGRAAVDFTYSAGSR